MNSGNKTKTHTPGPWRLSDFGLHITAKHRGMDEMLVANCG